MTKKEVKQLYFWCNLALIIAAMILGLSFVAQKAGMEFVGPFTFNTLRFFIGSFCLIPVMLFMNVRESLAIRNESETSEWRMRQRSHARLAVQRGGKWRSTAFGRLEPKTYSNKVLVKAGVLAGIVLFFAFSINQYCMIYASAGKAGFLTSLYIVFVPLLAVSLRQKISRNVVTGLILALVGVYLLCAKGGFSFEIWDIFIIISAFFFAVHILIVSYFSKKVSPVKLSCLQFMIAGILSLPLMIMENPQVSSIVAGAKPILFIGVIVTGVAYTLQIFGQKAMRPVVATLILSSEAVFAVLGGMFILGETLSGREILGCFVMIAAIIISQIRRKTLS